MEESTLVKLEVGQHFSLSGSDVVWQVESRTNSHLTAVKKDFYKIKRTFIFDKQYEGRKYFGACHGDRRVILHTL
jgi:hypothetical protein